jgi:low temperature requirement protein LtrA
MRRLVSPWEYRHLHAVANVRFAAGGFTLCLGLVLVSLGRRAETDRERRKCYGLAAWFLVQAALSFTGGLLDVTLARSAPPRT